MDEKKISVVYGVYDSASQPLSVRINDFFVDRKRIGIQEKSYFFHLLGVMLDAGIPILRSLQVLTKKTENPRFARIVNTMAYDIERGKTLSQSMMKFPDVFKEAEVGVVRSGEVIGNLQALLFRLAEQSERSHALYLKVRGALMYPATVLLALLASGGIVVTTVIPRLNEFFTQANVGMPFLTRLILSLGQLVVSFSWLLVMIAVFLVLILSFYLNTEKGRRRWDTFLLSAPWINHVIRKLNVSKFVQLLSILVDSGVPVNEAIKICWGAMNNRLYQDFLLTLKSRVEQGEKIAAVLGEVPFLFPETVVAMISVGENTGHLAIISDKLAVHYEREVEHSLANFTTILEPLITVFVGIAVAVLALALLGPIFSLSTLVAS